MHRVRLMFLVLLSVSLFACSKSGKGGSGDANDMEGGAGDGNIPVARAGSEVPDIHFDYDSAALSSSSQATLRDNAKFMMDNPGRSVQLEGHCDERGTNEYNLALGERRSRSSYDFLRTLGVKKEQMSTISYGEEIPLDPGHTEDSWSKNRRVHFALKK